jgi:hypothetical protein|tara:strand:- start:28 stop:210 length:183 start_codon:yes stop_codon:yes gene_type:complete
MAYKLKEKYKDAKDNNIKIPLKDLAPHQIEKLKPELRNKYFENSSPKKKVKNEVDNKRGI